MSGHTILLRSAHNPNDCHHHTPKLATFASRSTAPRKGPLQPARSTTTRGVYLLRGQPYSIIPYDHTWPMVYPALRTLSNVYVSTLLFMNRGSYYHCTDWTPGSLPTGRLVVYPAGTTQMLHPPLPPQAGGLFPAGKTHKLGKSSTNRLTRKSSRQTRRKSVYSHIPATIHIRGVHCHIPAATSNHPHPRGLPPAGSTTTRNPT